MEQREVEEGVGKDKVQRRSGEMRNRGRVGEGDTGIPVARGIPNMGLQEWARMGGLTNPDANRGGRRRGLWGRDPKART